MENNDNIDKNIQAMLNKLIADEWFAGNIYKQFILLVNPSQKSLIEDEMLDIANDELGDHMAALIGFASKNGYEFPVTYAELKKYADKKDVKLFESCKKNQDALFYVQEGIESEKRAIETYEKYVFDQDLKRIQDLDIIVQNNYYDEQDHLKKFNFIAESIQAMRQFS